MALGLGCFEGFEIDRGIAFTAGARVVVRVPDNFTVRTPKESTVNLKQNELRALISSYAEEVRMLIAQRTSCGEERHDLGRSAEVAKMLRERVLRMKNLVDELE